MSKAVDHYKESLRLMEQAKARWASEGQIKRALFEAQIHATLSVRDAVLSASKEKKQ